MFGRWRARPAEVRAPPAQGAPGGRGLVLPGLLGGVCLILPEQGFPCLGRCGGNAPRPARAGGMPWECRAGMVVLGWAPRPAELGAIPCTWRDGVNGRVPLWAEKGLPSCPAVLRRCRGGQKAPVGYVRPGMLSLERCGGTPPAHDAGKSLIQSAFGERD